MCSLRPAPQPHLELSPRHSGDSSQAPLLLDGLLSRGHYGLGSGHVELMLPLSCH